MNIVFCADRRVLPGLHVAAYSLLARISPAIQKTCFSIFSDTLDESDLALLNQTISSLKKSYSLALLRVDKSIFSNCPSLNGSWAPYYRLAVPQILDVERFLYVDADTMCDLDVSVLNSFVMGSAPAAMVPEAPMAEAIDRIVAHQLGNSPADPYFNSGVMLVNVEEWRRQKITELAMEYLSNHRPAFWDQSALNVVLHGKALSLDQIFNCITNMRKHWPSLRQPDGKINRLLHFVDHPKPWDFMGEWVHPQYPVWREVLDKTAMRGFRSWHDTPSRVPPKTKKARKAYLKVFKDRVLFSGYSRGWFKKIKGVPPAA